MDYRIENDRGHYNIIDENGNFVGSEDTYHEAEQTIKEMQCE